MCQALELAVGSPVDGRVPQMSGADPERFASQVVATAVWVALHQAGRNQRVDEPMGRALVDAESVSNITEAKRVGFFRQNLQHLLTAQRGRHDGASVDLRYLSC